jgi:hypothetical protein
MKQQQPGNSKVLISAYSKHSFLILITSLLFSVLALQTGLAQAKEPYTIKDKNFLPLRFYVGDIVELRLIINLAAPELLTPPEPAKLPQSPWLFLKQVEVMQITSTQYEVRIFFSAFKPGNHQLPALKLGRITLTGLTLDARSILDDKKIALPVLQPKPQILLPGTWFTIGLLIFLIILLPYLIIMAIKLSSKLFIRVKQAALKEQPRKKILKNLKKIKHQIAEMDPRSFFNELARLLREFMHERLQLPVLPATTTEVKLILDQTYPQLRDAKHLRDLISFFKTADYVRFGGRPIKKKEMNSLIDTIIALVGTLDKLEDNNHVEF